LPNFNRSVDDEVFCRVSGRLADSIYSSIGVQRTKSFAGVRGVPE
jgi:hypothetical protein